MGDKSQIEWTDATWNPVTGCTKISPGCKNCYAEKLAKRLQGMGNPSYENGFELTMHNRMLRRPLTWKKPRRIFVNSMSDLFHVDVSVDFIDAILDVMLEADWHTFQLLTKRSESMRDYFYNIRLPDHIWVGVSVENADYVHRIDDLRLVNSAVRFLSLEPLLGPLDALDLRGIGWVIVGGESGPGARPVDPDWVRDIRDQCVAAGVPFFFKQWGGVRKKENGRLLDGRTWDEMP